MTTQEHQVVDAAASLLANDDTVFQRAGLLVRVSRETAVNRTALARIEMIPPPVLRNRLAFLADWIRPKQVNEQWVESPCHIPDWAVSALYYRGDWPGVRALEGVTAHPLLREDGTVLDRPGYDDATGLWADFPGGLGELPKRVDRKAAVAACAVLADVVGDFPFRSEAHRSAWLAALLTPLARQAFDGPAPMFLVEANTSGTGKGLLLELISLILDGRAMPVTPWPAESEELRKKITGALVAGQRTILFDNIATTLGGDVIEAALTSTIWQDRPPFSPKSLDLPMTLAFYATANNCKIGGDMARRICLIRLESPLERPEERTNLKRPALARWVLDHRSELLTAALTVLRAYAAAGWPAQPVKAWGRYEGWTQTVQSALVWCGLADPTDTRVEVKEHSDGQAHLAAALLGCWERLDPERRGLTAAEVMDELDQGLDPELVKETKTVLAEMFAKPDARQLGYRVRSLRRRIYAGRFFDKVGDAHKTTRWAVFPEADFYRQPSG